MATTRKPYPCDVCDQEWALVAPYLTLLPESAGQRSHALREVFNGLRYLVRYGVAWRAMPNDLPPWHAVYDQAQRWQRAGCFEALAHDLRAVLRLAAGRNEEPSAAVLDSRTLRSTPESGGRAGWDGHKRTRGSKLHLAVDTLGHLLALRVTPPTRMTAQRWPSWPGPCRTLPARAYAGLCRPGLHRRAAGRGRRRRTASPWRWSSCRRRNVASCSCRAACQLR